jgi:heme/copper-type cytochrome/quinol oxidase subunit 2
MFLVVSVLLIFLVFCVVFLVGSVLVIFLVFCVRDDQHGPHQKHNTEN